MKELFYTGINGYHSIFKCVSEIFSSGFVILPEDKLAKIVIKPNLNSNMNALTGNTTDLRLLNSVIMNLKELGFVDITVAEGYAGGFHREGINVIERLRVDELCRKSGVKILNANFCQEGVPVEFENGTIAQIAKIFVENDFFINLPKIKTHTETMLTCCCKSLVGCLIGQQNKKKVHESLFKNIIRLNDVIKPDLYIVDGLISMEGNGPTTGTPRKTDLIISGNNPYRLDLMVSGLMGMHTFESVPVLKEAYRKNVFTDKDIGEIRELSMNSYNFKLPKLSLLQKFILDQRWQKYLQKIRHAPGIEQICSLRFIKKVMFNLKMTQEVFRAEEFKINSLYVDSSKCSKCHKCNEYCPVGLNPVELDNIIEHEKCIKCLYCFSVCHNRAITVDGTLGFFEEQQKQYDDIIRKSL